MTDPAPRPSDGAGIRAALRDHLRDRMRARDKAAVEAIRGAVAAIDNAEAQPVDGSTATEQLLSASTSTDAAPRDVSDDEARAIVAREIDELLDAARQHRSIGKAESAAALERQADVLREILQA